MTIGSKGKIIEVKGNIAVVEIDGRKRTYPMREDVKVKKGDKVVVILDTIIGRG